MEQVVGMVEAKLVFQARTWKWEHKHSLKTGTKAMLSQITMRKSLLQMTVDTAATPASDGGPDTASTLSGWLHKHWSGSHFPAHRRWFVLAPDGSLSYAHSEEGDRVKVIPSGAFHSVKARADVKQVELACTHDDRHKEEVLVVEAADASEALQWRLGLCAAAAKSAHSSLALEAPLPNPLAPTPSDVPSRVAITVHSGHDLPAVPSPYNTYAVLVCRVHMWSSCVHIYVHITYTYALSGAGGHCWHY